MDIYLRECYADIISVIYDKLGKDDHCIPILCASSLHELLRGENERFGISVNRNEEGRLHSRYLGDRYEPAVIVHHDTSTTYYYYLFDGEIKDRIHPFSVTKYHVIHTVKYYSSDRIEQGLPITISECHTHVTMFYNSSMCIPIIKKGYRNAKEKISLDNYTKQDYTLHYMEESILKFTD